VSVVEVSGSGAGEQLRTVECAICGDEYGHDFRQFSHHLADHSYDDLVGGDRR